jgi:hypothetical protein
MGIVRNRWVFGRALVSTLAFAVSVGLLALWETGRGTVLSAGADARAPEFAYSGDNGPGFWGRDARLGGLRGHLSYSATVAD